MIEIEGREYYPLEFDEAAAEGRVYYDLGGRKKSYYYIALESEVG